MPIKTLKGLAMLCLALAMAAVALAFVANQRRVAIQGPSALAVLPSGEVWLGVDDALWHFDAQGRRLAVLPAGADRLPGAISNLVVHPSGQLVAQVRDDPRLHFLDPATGALRSRLSLQWPADLARHSARSIYLAFHPDGRVAVATGGGHTVAVFDAQGRFLARTAPGQYEFTNGLWWEGDRLWTTDTNRFALVALDGANLRERSRVVLKGPVARCRFPAMVEPFAGPALLPTVPVATVVRFANGMVDGEVVDLMPDGQQRPYLTSGLMQPRDLKRRAGELFVVDGATYAVKRFGADRRPLADFGDEPSRQAWQASLALREQLHWRYLGGIGAAVLLFAAGLGFALRAQRMEQRDRLARLGVDLSQLGTLQLDARTRARVLLAMIWPFVATMALIALLQWTPALLWEATGLPRKQVSLAVLSVAMVFALVGTGWALRFMRRAASDPQVDALMNHGAVHALAHRDAFWKVRRPGELPRETMMLNMNWSGRHWLVLTNQRLLLFTSNLTDYVLKSQWGRRDVVRAAVVPAADMTRQQRMQASLGNAVLLRIELRDGTALEGLSFTPLTAQRVVDMLQGSAGPGAAAAPPALAPGQVPDEAPGLRQAMASLLVPGLGQWMQGRGGTAMIFFCLWAALLVVAALPVAWTLWAPRAAVHPSTVLLTVVAYVLMCGTAAFDAWRMRQRAV